MTDHGKHDHGAEAPGSAQGGAAHSDHGHGGVGKYLVVFGILCVLTAVSFLIGNSPLKETTPEVTWVSMMAVSCAKALLVILFFMHLKWEANWKYVLTIPASIMSIFLVLMLVPDVGLRYRHYTDARRLHAAEENSAAAHAGAEHSKEGVKGDSPGAGSRTPTPKKPGGH